MTTIPATEEARIRATVARRYRAARHFATPFMSAHDEANGWARDIADQYLKYGTPSPSLVLYYAVAVEYVEAARRLAQRRAERRQVRAA